MAWEGGDFTRDDLYTLFVTTRILNFLKSRREGARARLGDELLETLLASGRLLAANGRERRPLPRFRTELFFDVWSQLEYVTALDGRRVETQTRAERARRRGSRRVRRRGPDRSPSASEGRAREERARIKTYRE